jgi:multiple antibiotic resistance protein
MGGVADDLITAFVTLFVVVDPLGLGPIFLGLTRGMGSVARRRIATEASGIAFAVLAGMALVGDWLLRKLGIGLPAFRIAGGLLLFVIAFEMVFERRQQRKTDDAVSATHEGHVSVAAFPLAIPLMAGPGAITASVLLSARADGEPLQLVLLLAIIGVVVLICLLVFLLSPTLEKLLGHKGQIVFARLLGVLLAALAVQFVLDGILEVSGQR